MKYDHVCPIFILQPLSSAVQHIYPPSFNYFFYSLLSPSVLPVCAWVWGHVVEHGKPTMRNYPPERIILPPKAKVHGE